MPDEGPSAPAPSVEAPAAPAAAPITPTAAPTSAAAALATPSAPSAPAPTVTDQSGAEQTWYNDVHQDHVGMFENKKWGSLDALAESYKNLEAMRGVPEAELLRIPKAEDADGLSAMYNRLGRPDEASGYQFEGVENADWFKETAHTHGLNEEQAMGIIKGYDTQLATMNEAAEADYQTKTQLGMDNLKKEWGAEYDANSEYARSAARKFGVTDEHLNSLERSMGTEDMFHFLAKLGRATSEGSYAADSDRSPAEGDLGRTPAAAKDARTSLIADPAWKAAYHSKDKQIREGAMKQLRELSELAYDQEQ